jgi:hypothetical protein
MQSASGNFLPLKKIGKEVSKLDKSNLVEFDMKWGIEDKLDII